MIKSSLFSTLYEGGGSNKPNKNEINAISDIDSGKDLGAPEETVKPRKVKGQGKQVKDLQASWEAEKATYGNMYIPDNDSVMGLLDEISALPFKYDSKSFNELLVALKLMMFFEGSSLIGAMQKQKNMALMELAQVLGYEAPLPLDPKADLKAFLSPVPAYEMSSQGTEKNPMAYSAIVGLVFPFIHPTTLNRALNRYDSVNTTLAEYAELYGGALITKIDWASGNVPNFEAFEHITSPALRNFLITLKSVIDGGQTDAVMPPRLVRMASNGAKVADAGFSKSVVASVAKGKHLNNVTKNVYYSLVTRALQFNADLLELSDKGVKEAADNPNATNLPQLLSDKAQTLVSARIISVEKNPFLYKGLLGHNSRVQLAFDYAKKVSFKKNKHKLIADKTTDKVKSLFEDVLKNVPGISAHFDKLPGIFDSYFRPPFVEGSEEIAANNSNETPVATTEVPQVPPTVTEANAQVKVADIPASASSLKQELDAFSAEGMAIVSAELSEEMLGSLYKKISQNVSLLDPKPLDPKTAVEVYLHPFKAAVIERLAVINSITQQDIETVFNIGNATTDFLGGLLTKKKMREYLKAVQAYDQAKASSGDDEGYKFLRLVSDVQNLIHQAKQKIKTTKSTTEDEEEDTSTEKKVQDTINRAAGQYKGIREQRKRILDTKHLLQSLPTRVNQVLKDIKNSILSLSPELLQAVISGAADETEQASIDSFIDGLVEKVYNTHFSNQYLGLLASDVDELDPETIKMYVATDLKEKSHARLLIVNGQLKSYVSLYDGLTHDFIDFINLAASIKDTHKGITVDENGNIDFAYGLETLHPKDAFFTKFFFGELTSRVSSDPVVTMAARRTALKRLREPLIGVLNDVTLEQFLTPEIIKEQPKLASKLNVYLKDLKNVANAGILLAMRQMDTDILEYKGGQSVPLQTKDNTLSFQLPITADEEYETTITALGATALSVLGGKEFAKSPEGGISKTNTTQEFFRQLVLFDSMGGASLVESFSYALDIISTAINVDIARRTFYGDKTQLEAINGLMRKYQRSGNTEAYTNLQQAKAKADAFVGALHSATVRKTKDADGNLVDKPNSGIIGTSVLSGKDNHIDNQLLFNVLSKFETILRQDSWASMAVKYAAEEEAQLAAGTYPHSDLNLIVSKLGMAFTRIGEAVTVQGPALPSSAPVTEATDPMDFLAKQLQHNPQEPSQASAPLVQGERGAKANTSGIKQIVKDMEHRIYGFQTTTLNKGQKHGQQTKIVTSYKDMFNRAARSMDASNEILGSYFTSTNNKGAAIELVKTSEQVKKNFAVLTEFFTIIAGTGDVSGEYTANIPVQKRLLDTLQKLYPVEFSKLFSEAYIETPRPNTPQYSNALLSSYAKVPGLSALVQLLNGGRTMDQIKQDVAKLIAESASMTPEDKAKLNAMADLRDLDPADTPDEHEVAVKAPDVAMDVNQKAAAFVQAVSSKPLEQYMIPQNKGEYMSRYATLFDPATYAAVAPEQAATLKKLAVQILYKSSKIDPSAAKPVAPGAGIEAATKFNSTVAAEILAGNVVNKITGQPVKSLLDPAKLFESRLAFAMALLEAEEEPIEQPVNSNLPPEQQTEIAAKKAEEAKRLGRVQDLQDEPLRVLAAVLIRRGITASQEAVPQIPGEDPSEATSTALKTSAGQPYLWDDWNPPFWVLWKTSPGLSEHTNLVNRLFNTKDVFEFLVGRGKYVHAELLNFKEIKQLVDGYYKPEQLNTEPTNEPIQEPKI